MTASLAGRASGLFVSCVYGSATVAGYVIGWIVGRQGWTVAGNIQLVGLCLVGAVIALLLQPEQMSRQAEQAG